VGAADFWGGLRHCTHRFFDDSTIWRLSVPSNAVLEPGEKLLIDWGGALRWYAGEAMGARARTLASGVGGTAMCWRGQTVQPRFHPLSKTVAQIHRRLKQHFDPRVIFNRGRLVAVETGA